MTTEHRSDGTQTEFPWGDKTVIFFDGVCGLCNTWVDWLIRNDQHQRLLFAPLQGATAQQMLAPGDIADLDSLVVLNHNGSCRRSQAALLIMKKLGWPWSLLATTLELFPRFVGDFCYAWIARRRYKIWGKLAACRIPKQDERARFLP